jgi:two-component SAPR family response regulator
MNIIAVDDEIGALHSTERAIRQACPDSELTIFRSPKEAIAFAKCCQVSVAFLDIEMGEMKGLNLALEIKRINPKANIIFVTAYADYAGNAMHMHASGYVMKPATPEKIREEIDNLRFPAIQKRQALYVRCFGTFDVLTKDGPLEFPRVKTKELLAYLIDRRGASVTNHEIIGVLWEDDAATDSRKSQLRSRIAELRETLKQAGAEDWVVKKRDSIAVKCEVISCDYYDLLDGNMAALNSYMGEYMSQYSWAEETNGWLYGRKSLEEDGRN